MKKGKVFSLLLITTICLMVSMIVGCDFFSQEQPAHTHSYSSEWVSNATHHWQACSGCDEVRYKEEHDWDAGVVTTQPTEGAEGVRTYTCGTCGKTKTEVIPALSHTHNYSEEVVKDKYLVSEATCTSPAIYYYSCSCGEKGTDTFRYGEALGHSFTNYVSNNDATCTKDGTKTAKCNRCDVTDTVADSGSAHGHSFTNYVSNNDATCTKDGTKTAKCDHCDEVNTVIDEGSALGHSFTNYVNNTDATCTQDATRIAKCDRCDATDIKTIAGSATGHSFSSDWTKDDTYHWHVATCGHDVVGSKEEHNWVEDVSARVPASMEQDGEATYDCSVCGAHKVVVVRYGYEVTFYDYDNTVLGSERVAPGGSAQAPQTPYRAGYRFNKWNGNYENVNNDTSVYAQYVRVFMVEFVDYDGSIIDTEEIDAGSSISAPNNNPSRINYVFDGWYLNGEKLSANFTRTVNSDLQIEARYIRQYTVTFVDYDGRVIDTKVVNSGDTAAYPTHPSRIGYSYNQGSDGWDKDNTNITANTTITALYEINYYNVRFLTPDNQVIKAERVAYGHYATAPTEIDELFFTWNRTISGYDKNTAYTDPVWDKPFDEITADTEVKLVYGTKVTQTVLIMSDYTITSRLIQDGNKANAIFYIYSPTETINGLNIEISYKIFNAQGEQINYISLDDTFVDEVKRDKYVNINNYSGYNNNYNANIDTNNLSVQFVWSSDGNGNSLANGNNAVMAIAFSVEPNTPAGEYEIQILESSYYINSEMKKVQPVIISGKIIVVE